MLSKDILSGVTDDVVLLRCAVRRILRLAACTMFATKREDDSFVDSLLNAERARIPNGFIVFNGRANYNNVYDLRSILATFSSRKSADGSSVLASASDRWSFSLSFGKGSFSKKYKYCKSDSLANSLRR